MLPNNAAAGTLVEVPIDIVIPYADTEGVFWTLRDGEVKVSGDPRLLARVGDSIDDQAVFSLLQYGAIIPPLTIWKNVHRLIPGYRYVIDRSRAPTKISFVPLPKISEPATSDLDAQATAIIRAIDEALDDVPDPVVLFSGGVDSGLIAARAASLRKREVLLLNYSFGSNDPESRLAEAMARVLGLPFERIYSSESLTACLDRPGEVYPFPFGDHSTVPTSALSREVTRRVPGRPVIDGIGADGGFGMVAKIAAWMRVWRMPHILRSAVGACYRGVWRRTDELEYRCRLFRRSATMPMLSAVIAQNALAGILYKDFHASTVHERLSDWFDGWSDAGDSTRRTVSADLALVCANNFAQKGRAILQGAGIEPRYPFLSSSSLALSLSASTWEMDEPKAPLKHALARYVPREMVYRPKSGFVDPAGSLFRTPQFIQYLRDAAMNGPIAHMVHGDAVLQQADWIAAGKPLPPQALNCAWVIVFTDRWLRTVALK